MSIDAVTERAIADRCREVLQRHAIPGISIAVVDSDRVLYADGVGSRDRATNSPATSRTLYGIGSVTKSFAAVSLLQLVEHGLCDLSDPVGDHLPVEFDDGEEPITLHHLLTHSSGLPSLGVSETLLARRLRIPDPGLALGDADDFYAHLDGAGDERTGPPGERFAYCNSGYTLVGEAIEELTGRPFDEYVTTHVLDPLQLGRATFDDMAFSTDDDHMTQYLRDEDELVAASLPTRELGRAAGGLLASVEDLARYVRMHLNGGAVGGVRLLDAEMLERAHAGHVDVGDGRRYGYGWFRDDEFLGEHTLVGHSGSIAVSSAYAGFLPEADLGVAVAANTSPPFPLGVVGQAVLAEALGVDPDEAVPFFARQRRHDLLTGEYAAYRGVMNATVDREGESLRVQFDHPLKRSTSVLFPPDEADADETVSDQEAVPDDNDRETGPDDGNQKTGPDDGDDERRTYRYRTLGPGGERKPVEFRRRGDDVSLLVDRWHLHKVSE